MVLFVNPAEHLPLGDEGLNLADGLPSLPDQMQKVTVSSFQQKNNDPRYQKPCEDHLLADEKNGVFIIADGISRDARKGDYPTPSPAALCSEAFCKAFHATILSSPLCDTDMSSAMREAVTAANTAVKEMNERLGLGSDFLENDFGGTVFSAVVIKDGVLYYAMIGDCSIRIQSDSKVELLTCAPPTPIGRNVPQDAGAVQQSTAYRREHFRNHGGPGEPNHYGVMNGESGALPFVVYGSQPVSGIKRFVISSDGVEPLLEESEANSSLSPAAIVQNMIELESQPGSQIRSDDKSVIAVDCH
jgi:serine/threonine protein phosphatase PrpC